MRFNCPNCGESIDTAGKVCAYCGHDKRSAARYAESQATELVVKAANEMLPLGGLLLGGIVGGIAGLFTAWQMNGDVLLYVTIGAVPSALLCWIAASRDAGKLQAKVYRRSRSARRDPPTPASEQFAEDVADWLGKPGANQ